MNISLSKGTHKKKKLGFGLNKKGGNVFGGSDEDNEDDDNDDLSQASDNEDGRAAVNRTLRAEQEALRKRASAATAAAAQDEHVYDYDGAYDEMHASSGARKSNKTHAHEQQPPEKKSRYIGDLLKAAKQRERERDVIHERKVAKEHAQEEAEYRGKDKFVTAAYKKKLAERQIWTQEEEAKRREEEEQDVTKKTGEGAFASFYGNLNRNVAMGGGGASSTQAPQQQNDDADTDIHADGKRTAKTAPASLGFMDGFERAAPDNDKRQDRDAEAKQKSDGEHHAAEESSSPASMRKKREEKLARARLRYFQRQGITMETTSTSEKQ